MERYVKDVIDIDGLTKRGYKKICICAGVGAGKNTWVDEVLCKKGSVLCVTSRKATVEQGTTSEKNLNQYYHTHTAKNQTMITNAKLASIVRENVANGLNELDEFIDLFDYIVIDEAHSIATDSTFAPSSMGVYSFLDYVIQKEKTVILMTGTIAPIKRFLLDGNWLILNHLDTCNYVHPERVDFIKNASVERRIVDKMKCSKVIYFMNHVTDIAELYKKLISNPQIDVTDINVIVAESRRSELNKKIQAHCKCEIENIVKKELENNNLECKESTVKKAVREKFLQIEKANEEVYQVIVSRNKLPDFCKILLTTSVLREGVNIFNDDITMICDNHILSNLIQFFGRVRLKGTSVYIVENSTDHKVEKDDWLYNYAKYEVDAANSYLNNLDKKGDIFFVEDVSKLKYHVCSCNKYIYFDDIAGMFKVSAIRYNEEDRLITEACSWIKRIKDYCAHYDITCASKTTHQIYKDILPDVLERAINNEIKFFNENKNAITNIINDVCGTNAKSISKLNKALSDKGYSVEIESHTETKGERRNDNYWMIVQKN